MGVGSGGLRASWGSGRGARAGRQRQLGLEVLLSWEGQSYSHFQEHTYFNLAMALGRPTEEEKVHPPQGFLG